MKITKRQLKRIIREEKAILLSEGTPLVHNTIKRGEPIWSAIGSIIDAWMDQTEPNQWAQIAAELHGYAEDVENSIPEEAPPEDSIPRSKFIIG